MGKFLFETVGKSAIVIILYKVLFAISMNFTTDEFFLVIFAIIGGVELLGKAIDHNRKRG